jgi:hypothetical protein
MKSKPRLAQQRTSGRQALTVRRQIPISPSETGFHELCRAAMERQERKKAELNKIRLKRDRWTRLAASLKELLSTIHWPRALLLGAAGEAIVVLLVAGAR